LQLLRDGLQADQVLTFGPCVAVPVLGAEGQNLEGFDVEVEALLRDTFLELDDEGILELGIGYCAEGDVLVASY